MCFSAPGSFVAGAIISSIGTAAILRNKEPSRRLFASIPIVFGIQQFSEGFVWLALQSPGHDLILRGGTFIFLIMALIVWPSLVPLSVLLMEHSEKKRKALYILLAMGMALSLYYGREMLTSEVTARISSHHILYAFDFPEKFPIEALGFYLIATIAPLFISSLRRVHLFGAFIVLALSVTMIFFEWFLVSVWCFFAALSSIIILWAVTEPGDLASTA